MSLLFLQLASLGLAMKIILILAGLIFIAIIVFAIIGISATVKRHKAKKTDVYDEWIKTGRVKH